MGIIPSELEESYVYYILGRELGWTPDVVDKLDWKLVADILFLIKYEKEQMSRGVSVE